MLIREKIEENERLTLSKYAALSLNSKGRDRAEEKCPFRTEFQRDRDRIIHSNAFRRLKHKTQVYLIPFGDHYRTRLTHTLEVAQIARTISRSLSLNEDLAEAIALGHDLGHTPFGHAGEDALNRISTCGFKHYEQSLKVVEYIEKNGKGLNLSFEVKEGILSHTNKVASTLEGYIVRLADRIAYINHDIEDSIMAKIITEEMLPKECTEVLGTSKTARITTMVSSIINNSGETIQAQKHIMEAQDKLHKWMFDNVYKNPLAKSEEKKAKVLVESLYEYFMKKPEELPKDYAGTMEKFGIERGVIDYIAGMTDSYAIRIFQSIFIPKGWDKL